MPTDLPNDFPTSNDLPNDSPISNDQPPDTPAALSNNPDNSAALAMISAAVVFMQMTKTDFFMIGSQFSVHCSRFLICLLENHFIVCGPFFSNSCHIFNFRHRFCHYPIFLSLLQRPFINKNSTKHTRTDI
jgi:hypothetical protein